MKKLSIIFVLALIIGLVPFADSISYATPAQNATRHTFTWIAQVIPELAQWAKNLSFTDVVCSDSSDESYQNLAHQGIEYWYLVTAMVINTTDTNTLREQLARFVQASPNGNVYLDDTNYLLMKDGGVVFNAFLDAVRYIQASVNCQFILDGFINEYVTNIYTEIRMAGINFDAYQNAVDSLRGVITSYASVLPTLAESSPNSLGLYIWAYCTGGAAWDAMPAGYLTSVYDQALRARVDRVIVWNGYSIEPESNIYRSCLYYYPEWWGRVRLENVKFLNEGK